MVTQHVRRGLLIGAALLCPAALAQSGPDPQSLSAVLACADIEREILRLECYDDAVAALRRGPAANAASARSQAAAASPAARGPAAAPAERAAETDDVRTPPPRVVAERELPAARGAGAARSSGGAESTGGDRQVTIVEVRTQVPGRAVFITSEGEEFVQTSGRLRLFLPEVPFQANLRSGAVGGRFLTPEGTRRSIRISVRD